ncbi:MAG: hypothetical protein ACRDQF_17235 [Thermocrispum sp.]
MQVPQGRTGSDPAQATARSARRTQRVLPPGPLPTAGIELAAAAAEQLGWRGVVLPETTLLGRRVHVVARLRTDVHAERIATGMGPVTDKAAVSTWTWPELEHSAPSAAVEIIGVVAVARHWRTALAWAVPFTRYFPAAMVLPSTALLTHDYVNNCLPRARAYGIAVLWVNDAAEVGRDLPGSPDRVIPAADTNSRWIDEVAYDHLLTTADVSAHVE